VKIFVSHSHQDTGAAKALIDMLLSNITLDDKEIRCTSVPDHTIRFGKSISQLLKEDINVAPAILALISQQSLQSKWVMFELGAAWGLGKDIYPVVGPGLDIRDLPGPLASLPCIVIESQDAASRLAELIKQVSEDCNLEIKTGGYKKFHLPGNYLKKLRNLKIFGSCILFAPKDRDGRRTNFYFTIDRQGVMHSQKGVLKIGHGVYIGSYRTGGFIRV